ncbi:MAG: TIGR01841 family phasin [Pseudomonadota bacterium]
MAKANGKAKGGAEAFDAFSEAPAEAMKKSYERMMAFGGDFAELNRTGLEALTQSARAAGKGFEAMNAQTLSFMKQTMEQTMEASRAMTGVKSMGDMTEMQATYAKTTFKAYVEQMNEMAGLFASTMRETVEPLNAQAGAVVEKFQGAA